MLAAENGHLDTTRLLIEKGANVHAVNKDGKTVLYYAKPPGMLICNFDMRGGSCEKRPTFRKVWRILRNAGAK